MIGGNDGSVISLSNITNDYAGGTIINGAAGTAAKRATLNVNGLGALSSGPVTMSYGNLSLKDDSDGTGSPQNIAVSNAITLASGTDNGITVGRLGTAYAPYYSQAANKTMQLNVTSAWGANSLTVTNNNGYGADLTNAIALTGTPTFSVANATASNVVQGLTISGAGLRGLRPREDGQRRPRTGQQRQYLRLRKLDRHPGRRRRGRQRYCAGQCGQLDPAGHGGRRRYTAGHGHLQHTPHHHAQLHFQSPSK